MGTASKGIAIALVCMLPGSCGRHVPAGVIFVVGKRGPPGGWMKTPTSECPHSITRLPTLHAEAARTTTSRKLGSYCKRRRRIALTIDHPRRPQQAHKSRGDCVCGVCDSRHALARARDIGYSHMVPRTGGSAQPRTKERCEMQVVMLVLDTTLLALASYRNDTHQCVQRRNSNSREVVVVDDRALSRTTMHESCVLLF